LKEGLGYNIDWLWFDTTLESIRFGDIYIPDARLRVLQLYLINVYNPTSFSTLPIGEAFITDDDKSEQNRFQILLKNGSNITCQTIEGTFKHFNGNKQVSRGGNLARGPDTLSESKVALAIFSVMRLSNVDNIYSFGFIRNEQSTPHFMRYNDLVGA